MYPVSALSSVMLQLKTICSETLHSLIKPVRNLGSKAQESSSKIAKVGKDIIDKIHNSISPQAASPFNDEVGLAHKYPGIRIIYVNGIHNSTGDCQDAAKRISRVFDDTIVHYTCVPTKGSLRDLASAAKSLLAPKKTAESQALLENIKGCLKISHTVGIIAHSAGALVVEQAHKELTDEERSRIHIFTLGPAIALSKKIGKKVKNYVSVKDPIPTIGRFVRGHFLNHPEKIKAVGIGTPTKIAEAHYFTGDHYQGILPEIKERLLKGLKPSCSLSLC